MCVCVFVHECLRVVDVSFSGVHARFESFGALLLFLAERDFAEVRL